MYLEEYLKVRLEKCSNGKEDGKIFSKILK